MPDALITQPAELATFERTPLSLVRAYPTLLKRIYLKFKRSPALIRARLTQASSYGILLVLFYSRLGNEFIDIQNRVGYIQQLCPLLFIGLLVRHVPAELT
jgi:hypothetical protein